MHITIELVKVISENANTIVTSKNIEDPLPEYHIRFLATLSNYGPFRAVWYILTDGENSWIKVNTFQNDDIIFLVKDVINSGSPISTEHCELIKQAIRDFSNVS